MEKPVLQRWVEADIDKVEEFKVFKPTRLDPKDGKGCRAFKIGETVKISGFAKKDAYFQNKIMYPADYEKVVAYEKDQKVSFSEAPGVSKDSASSSQDALKKK